MPRDSLQIHFGFFNFNVGVKTAEAQFFVVVVIVVGLLDIVITFTCKVHPLFWFNNVKWMCIQMDTRWQHSDSIDKDKTMPRIFKMRIEKTERNRMSSCNAKLAWKSNDKDKVRDEEKKWRWRKCHKISSECIKNRFTCTLTRDSCAHIKLFFGLDLHTQSICSPSCNTLLLNIVIIIYENPVYSVVCRSCRLISFHSIHSKSEYNFSAYLYILHSSHSMAHWTSHSMWDVNAVETNNEIRQHYKKLKWKQKQNV